MKKIASGFTLIELIIVVAIIALLAAALYVAIDPAKRIGTSQDSKRWADITSILDAILTYTADVQALPTDITGLTAGTNYIIALDTEAGGAGSGTVGCQSLKSDLTKANIKRDLVSNNMATLPVDPLWSSNITAPTTTGYFINRSSTNRVKIGACLESAYATASITVQR